MNVFEVEFAREIKAMPQQEVARLVEPAEVDIYQKANLILYS
jgi:hypothetical protein